MERSYSNIIEIIYKIMEQKNHSLKSLMTVYKRKRAKLRAQKLKSSKTKQKMESQGLKKLLRQ